MTTAVLPTFFSTALLKGVKANNWIKIYEVDRVADDVLDAVLTNEEVKIVPAHLNLLCILQTIVPTKAFDKIYEILGGYQVMDEFKGKY
jgi:hypothetical protein